MTEQIPVIFRAERSGAFKSDVTAVFPTLPASPDCMVIYAHIGQHGEARRGWYHRTRAARPEEYADLLDELRRIYERDGDVKLVARKRLPALWQRMGI